MSTEYDNTACTNNLQCKMAAQSMSLGLEVFFCNEDDGDCDNTLEMGIWIAECVFDKMPSAVASAYASALNVSTEDELPRAFIANMQRNRGFCTDSNFGYGQLNRNSHDSIYLHQHNRMIHLEFS